MRTEVLQITLYCELFNLTSEYKRTVAGRKIKKASKNVPSEYIFSLMSNEDLRAYLDFCKNHQQEIVIKLKHNKKTQQDEIKVEKLNELVEIDQIEGMKYYAYRSIKKTDNDLIKEYETSIDYDEDKYHKDDKDTEILYSQFLKWLKKLKRNTENYPFVNMN